MTNIITQEGERSIIFTVDTTTNQIINEKDTGKFSLGFVGTSKGNIMFYNSDRDGNVLMHNVLTEKEPVIIKLHSWAVGNYAGGGYVTPDKKWIILPEVEQMGKLWVIDTELYQVRMIDQIPGYFRGFATSSSGNKLYVGALRYLVVIDLVYGKILSVIERKAHQICVSLNGGRLYLPLSDEGIDVIDATSYDLVDPY